MAQIQQYDFICIIDDVTTTGSTLLSLSTILSDTYKIPKESIIRIAYAH